MSSSPELLNTSARAADNTRAILMPQDHDLSDKEAKPWRKTMSKVLTPNIVMNMQARPIEHRVLHMQQNTIILGILCLWSYCGSFSALSATCSWRCFAIPNLFAVVVRCFLLACSFATVLLFGCHPEVLGAVAKWSAAVETSSVRQSNACPT